MRTVESIDEYPTGYRDCDLYQFVADSSRVCLFFGGDDYEGLDPPYTLHDGVVRDGDGDVIEFVEPVGTNHRNVDQNQTDTLVDPELQDLEDNGGGYLSESGDDTDSDFLFGDDGDKNIVKM